MQDDLPTNAPPVCDVGLPGVTTTPSSAHPPQIDRVSPFAIAPVPSVETSTAPSGRKRKKTAAAVLTGSPYVNELKAAKEAKQSKGQKRVASREIFAVEKQTDQAKKKRRLISAAKVKRKLL